MHLIPEPLIELTRGPGVSLDYWSQIERLALSLKIGTSRRTPAIPFEKIIAVERQCILMHQRAAPLPTDGCFETGRNDRAMCAVVPQLDDELRLAREEILRKSIFVLGLGELRHLTFIWPSV